MRLLLSLSVLAVAEAYADINMCTSAFSKTCNIMQEKYCHHYESFGLGPSSSAWACRERGNIAQGKTASLSSQHGGHAASIAVDGQTSDNRLAHSSADGQMNPWLMIDLGQTYSVGGMRLFNRNDGNCASRLMQAGACTGRVLSGTYDSDQQGAMVGVSHTRCYGGLCPGFQQCQKITSMNDANIYDIDCSGKQGRYLILILPGTNRMLNVQELQAWGSVRSAAYFDLPYGASSCAAAGGATISTRSECWSAISALGLNVGNTWGPASYNGVPSGCSVKAESMTVGFGHFNTYTGGVGRNDLSPICAFPTKSPTSSPTTNPTSSPTTSPTDVPTYSTRQMSKMAHLDYSIGEDGSKVYKCSGPFEAVTCFSAVIGSPSKWSYFHGTPTVAMSQGTIGTADGEYSVDDFGVTLALDIGTSHFWPWSCDCE